MVLNFRQLEVFRAIMIAKTVSGAAELLHVSQPGISRTLKYIEYKLGVDLFERRKGRLVPTPEGKELFKELESIYQRFEDLETTIYRITHSEDMRLNVGCTPSLGHYLLPKLLASAKKKIPKMMIKVDILPHGELVDYIAGQSGDFALTLIEPDHPLVSSEPSISSSLVCVMPEDHELSTRKFVSFKDICAHDMVMYRSDSVLGRMLQREFDKLDLEPKMSVQVRYNDDACAMAAQGLGIAVTLDFTVMGGAYPQLKAVPLKAPKLRVHLMRNSNASFSNNVKIFYEKFRTELTALGRHPDRFEK